MGAIGATLGLYWDNGKEHGNYYNGLYRGYMHVMHQFPLHFPLSLYNPNILQ